MSTTTAKTRKSTATAKTGTSNKAPAKPTASAAKKAPTKSAAKAKTPAPAKAAAPAVVDAPQAVIMGPVLRKKELVEEVVSRSGKKKRDVKPVVEMMLSVLGEAIADNRELNLQPFGKLKVRKEKKLANGRIVVTKIRQNDPVEATAAPSDAAAVKK